MENKINILRKEIDELDRNIALFLEKRFEIATQIINEKQNSNCFIEDIERETEIIENVINSTSKLDREFVERIFSLIFNHSKFALAQYKTNPIKTLIKTLKKTPIIIAGPCAVESINQINEIASQLSELGVKYLRGGVFKPRTSPYSFQGLGYQGLVNLKEAADKYDMYLVTEIMDSEQLHFCYSMIDVIQIGHRNMYNYELLKAIGKRTAKDKKPVILKRSFAATIDELLLSAEYIISEGNPNVILCLRGIRTYEQISSQLRFTPDLASILELKEKTKLKIIFDPSHSGGNSKYVIDLSKAALCLGVDGLLVECHTQPNAALVDGKQSIKPEQLLDILG